MQTITIDIETLKKIIKDTVRETIKEEQLKLADALLPEVDQSEMDEIISKYGNKPEEEEFTDMTDWIKNAD